MLSFHFRFSFGDVLYRVIRDAVPCGSLFLSQVSQLPFIPEEKFTPFIKIFFVHDTDSLGSQVGPCIITVVRFIIRLQTYVS